MNDFPFVVLVALPGDGAKLGFRPYSARFATRRAAEAAATFWRTADGRAQIVEDFVED